MKKNKIYVPAIIGVVALILGFSYMKFSLYRPLPIERQLIKGDALEETPLFQEINSTSVVDEEKESICVVHITGAVYQPNIYALPLGSRIYDVIELAGGATEDADLDQINLAMKIKDEQKIYIPSFGEEFDKIQKENNNNSMQLDEEDMHMININIASSNSLEALPGIGPVTAANIIEYREKNGAFQTIEDIQKVSRIGPKTFEKIKSKITVD
ncbi:MAG: transporter [Epulopiscium sp.]|nr:transporter [Candidatus Epulonipiscium sp.]